MTLLRTDIERALDELASQEEGMRFQGLAVVLGKKRWPELIARQRKKDFGLDAYAPSNLTPEKIGKGLAASITPTLKKISDDAKVGKENFPDLETLLFVTPARVGNVDRKRWEEAIRNQHGLDLHIIEREEIITLMTMPENASLRASFLHLELDAEPQVADLVEKASRAAGTVTGTWAAKTKGQPLMDLTAMRLDPDGAESAEMLSLEQIDQALSQACRIVLEAPAGCGKTTMLIQLAQRPRTAGIPFIVELSAWTASHRSILEYIAGMPAFQAEGLTATDLARVQQTEPFLLLLNGWNEITESNSAQANDALRGLERDFSSAGIIVATRTHHLRPPLPGALRLRLLRLRRVQRAAYLEARLGAQGAELRAYIDADPSLEDLTRTPFILSEVASLFQAGANIPSTKIGVLGEVLRLQEQREEHRNALQVAPIFGRQTDYMKALATAMTRRGAVGLPEAEARAVVAAVARQLTVDGQIEPVGAPTILATLTAHHVLERVDYPETTFQFEHQQLQEYYATLDVRALLLGLGDEDVGRFTADYVNNPAWAEPLRMIAETFAEVTGNGEIDARNSHAGERLVEMALSVDLVFAGELAQRCGETVWNKVRAVVSERFRAVYDIQEGNFQQCSLTAMLATGADDFGDIIVPLLSGPDQQTRLRTYRLWPDIHVSSLGPSWREKVRGWSDDARADFVSELLHHRRDAEVAAFAAEDSSISVKKAAASALMWTRSDEALSLVMQSMDAPTFEDVARENVDRMPAVLRPRTIAVMRKFVESTTNYPSRLRTALDLLELGESGLESVFKETIAALPYIKIRELSSHYIEPAFEYLRRIDPGWANEWVAARVAEGVFFEHEYWLRFTSAIPDGIVEKYVQRLETEDLENRDIRGMIALIASSADADLAARVFKKLRELWRKVHSEPGVRHEFEWQVMRNLEDLFRGLPDDIAVTGILSSVTNGDPIDIKVAADLLSRVARSDLEPLRITDNNLKARLRAYLKGSVEHVLHQDDFNGEEKANLASSIAQVGNPEDMADLVTLIRADIQRVSRGRAARAAGDRGPLGNGGIMSYSGWQIAAVMHLDAAGAVQVLIDLLSEPEYLSAAADALARDFVLTRERSIHWQFRHNLMLAAREGRARPPSNVQLRKRVAAALHAEIERLREQDREGKPASGLKVLAKALAAVDGHDSAAVVLDAISKPDPWGQYVFVETAERLLVAGVVLPAATVFAHVGTMLERTEKWMSDSDRSLLCRILELCPFVEDPAAGIVKMRDVLGKRRLRGDELRGIITALGESRSDSSIDFLHELASDANTLGQCEDAFINAFAAQDTPRAGELLLGFVDPSIRGISLTRHLGRELVLAAKLKELASRSPEKAARLLQLCEFDLPELNRQILSKVMHNLGTPEALTANLNLINDGHRSPIPRGVWDQLETTFVERRPYGQNPNAFINHARAANKLRGRLFQMSIEDAKRKKSASMLLGQIEMWRLEYGKPIDEPRHPALASGLPWPPKGIPDKKTRSLTAPQTT